jgi:hydroxymethylpyrimidine/phosphomethylpyrimidine kinase
MSDSSDQPETADTLRITPSATALTIAGSDPSGGAGLQADLKTFQHLGVYGMSVVTLLTVQNTQAVTRVEMMPPDLIREQLTAVLSDIPPRAIKTGALGNAETVHMISEELSNVTCPIVVDPVLVSKHGHLLADDDVVAAYKETLLPRAFLVTPNRFEAERLTGLSLTDDERVCEAIQLIQDSGARFVLIKLGTVSGMSQHMLGVEDKFYCIETPALRRNNTHGSGCILAAAITARLALGESDISAAVHFGIHRAYEAVYLNTHLGKGVHPAEIRAMRRE